MPSTLSTAELLLVTACNNSRGFEARVQAQSSQAFEEMHRKNRPYCTCCRILVCIQCLYGDSLACNFFRYAYLHCRILGMVCVQSRFGGCQVCFVKNRFQAYVKGGHLSEGSLQPCTCTLWVFLANLPLKIEIFTLLHSVEDDENQWSYVTQARSSARGEAIAWATGCNHNSRH